jgi:hypothetical protein
MLLLTSGLECRVVGSDRCSKKANGLCPVFHYEGIALRNTRGACNFLGSAPEPKAASKKVNALKASKRAAAGK